MGSRRRNGFILLLVLGLIVGSVTVILNKETKLGLDLRGGTQLVYEASPTPRQPEVTPESVDRALEIIRDRTDNLDVAEPEIQRLGTTQIQVGLPDVQDIERAVDQVGTTAQLYYYDFEPNVVGDPNRPVTKEYDAVKRASRQDPECNGCTAERRFYLADPEDEKILAGPEDEREDLFVDQPDREQPEGSEVLTVPQGTLVVADETNQPENQPDAKPGERPKGPFFVLRDRPALSGQDLRNPEQGTDQASNEPNVTFEFTDKGRQAFQRITRQISQRGLEQTTPGSQPNYQRFAIVLDNKLITNPIINFNELPDGIDGRTGAQISGNFTITDAQDLADLLRVGALPIELNLISQTTVSATLGQEALDQGLIAGLAGLLVVILFLVGFYRVLGLIAAVALMTYAAFFYALIELIPITLSLPGIAGLILTIGVAADSNIVIFERIKEEVRGGKPVPAAIALGYRRGIATIIDANVVTLLTAFILFVLATAGVKGFAFTLGVGTIVSLFTAVVLTQAVLGTFSRSEFMRRPSVLGVKRETRSRWGIDFMGLSRYFFSGSGVILMVGAISLATLGINLGIDFEAGTRIKASLAQEATVNQVRETLGTIDLADSEIQEVQDPAFGNTVFQIDTPDTGADTGGNVQEALQDEFGLTEGENAPDDAVGGFQSQSVGPTFGATVANSAILAVVMSLLLISAYVAFRFQAKFAVPVVIAMIHDLLLTAGVYSLTGREVSSATVAALLTILGYSLYDTIIVFDRIRENLPRLPRAAFSQVVNTSMREVLTRSLATTFSTLLPVVALFFFGGETLRDFAFALIVGVFSGTYSSIFIASPVLNAWKEREPTYRLRRRRLLDTMGKVPAFPEQNRVAKVDEGDESADDADADETPRQAPARRATGPTTSRYRSETPEEPEADAADPDAGAAGTAVGGAEESGSAPRRTSGRRRGRNRRHGRPR
ncbi:MAG: protein translocase subunit SecD [Solirubrobacterales bacterium]